LPLFGIPLIGFFVVAFLPFSSNEEKEFGKKVTLIFTLLTFVESLRL